MDAKITGITKITKSHQIFMPSAIRSRLGVETGDRLGYLVEDGRVMLVPVQVSIQVRQNNKGE